MPSIQGIPSVRPPEGIAAPKREESAAEFGNVFAEAVDRVEQYRIKAEDASNRFLNGESEEIHQVILAGQRAEIAFDAFLQVRNKVVQAYQEIMRMQM